LAHLLAPQDGAIGLDSDSLGLDYDYRG